jgi:drug/metabolite transporter (DMT)-like permease
MQATKRLRQKTHLLVVLMVAFSSAGNILLSKGMKQIGSVSVASAGSLATAFLHTVTNGLIWLGIGSFLLFFVCYMLVLSWADYSYVMPASAIGYAIVPLLGYLLLGEVVTSTRWAGVAVICLGVMLVGRTPPRTTESG